MKREPQTIMITGASSGIGAALAAAYAGPGRTLYLTGRNRARLDEVGARLRALGSEVETAVLDVCNRDAMATWIAKVDTRRPVDLLVANAGISAGTGVGLESEEQVRQIFAVNIDGVFNTLLPFVPLMRARGRGQIAIISSQASFRGMPGAGAYCASKAAERVYGEALRVDLAPFGVGVSVICPGFIRTPMTDVNPFPMPFLMKADRAAALIKQGLERNRGRIAFPWQMSAIGWLLATLPPGLVDLVLKAAPRKS